VGLCWIVAMVALPYASLRDPGYRGADFAPLEAAIAGVDPAPDAVVSDMVWVLGNLALRNPDMPLVWAGTGTGQGVLVTLPGKGATLAERLGRQAGPGVTHEIRRGNCVTVVEILPLL
jgi:hypothetical protein